MKTMKTRIRRWIAFAAVAAALSPALADALPRPASATFAKGAFFTVSGYAGASTLSGFPVLVRISNDSPSGFSYSDLKHGDTGADIAFIDTSGAGLPFEIDTWNPDGESLIWVRLPSMSQGTQFVMCWGSEVSTGKADVCSDNPWSDYAGVWHMGEEGTASGTTTVTLKDSTDNKLDATASNPKNGTSSQCAGVVGKGRAPTNKGTEKDAQCIMVDLSDSAKRSAVDAINTTENGNSFTVSFWVQPKKYNGDGTPKSQYLVGRRLSDSSGEWGIMYHWNGSSSTDYSQIRTWGSETASSATSMYHFDFDDSVIPSTAANALGNWYKFDVVYSGDNVAFYVNGGTAEGASLTGMLVKGPANNGSNHLYLTGTPNDASNGGTREFCGDMDEVRLCAGAKSADWIAADYATQTDKAFLTAGTATAYEETGDPVAGVSVASVGYVDATLAVNVASFGTGATSANVKVEVAAADDAEFANPVWTHEYTASETGATSVEVAGLSYGTHYIARATLKTDKDAELTTTSASFTTSTPGSPAGSAALLERGFTTISATVAATAFGAGAESATVRLEASTDGFTTEVASSGETAATLDAAQTLTVANLAPGATYALRAVVKNSWGIETVVPLSDAATRPTPFAYTDIGWTFSADGKTLEIDFGVTGLYDGATGTATLTYGGEAHGAKDVTAPGSLAWTGIAAQGYARAEITLSATVGGTTYTETVSAAIEAGKTSVLVDDIAAHTSATNAVRVRVGDTISLPEPGIGESYSLGNPLFASLDGTVVTALEPGILGVRRTDAEGAVTTMAVLILPDAIGDGAIYVFDEEAEAASGTSVDWTNPTIWKRADGVEDNSYPNGPDAIAVIPVYQPTSKTNSFKFGDSEDGITIGSLYFGNFCDINTHFQFGADGEKIALKRTDGGTPVMRRCNNTAFSSQVRLNGSYSIGDDGVVEIPFGTTGATDAYIGYGTDTGRVDVVGGTFSVYGSLALGYSAGSFGHLRVADGGAVSIYNAPTIGYQGSSVLEICDGGSFTSRIQVRLANSDGKSTTNAVVMTGGEFRITTTDASRFVTLMDGNTSGESLAKLQLDGGVMYVPLITGGRTCRTRDSAKDGVALVTANGGTLSPTLKDMTFIQYVEPVQCGEKGLTIDSAYNVSFDADFVNAEEADGLLVLTGSGTKTLAASTSGGTLNRDKTTVSQIVAAGGTVKFESGAKATSELVLLNDAVVDFDGKTAEDVGLSKLTVGSADAAGLLSLSAGSTLALATCPIEIVKANLVLSGTFEAGRTYTLITTSGEVSDATKAAWAASASVSGLDDSLAYEFATSNTDGVTSFTVAVTAAPEAIVWNGEGEGESAVMEKTYSDAITLADYAAQPVSVGEGATLNLTSKVTGGGIVKTGAGTLVLRTDAASSMPRGVTVKEGVLVVESASALGDAATSGGVRLAGGRFTYAGDGSDVEATLPGGLYLEAPNASDLVDLNIIAPLRVEKANVSSGCIFKRGAGRLTFAPGAGETMTLTADGSKWVRHALDAGDLTAEPYVLPTEKYGGFNVVEGTVEFTGDASSTIYATHNSHVGAFASKLSAQPVLVVDGLKAHISSSSATLNIGYTTKDRKVFPRLEIRNGAHVESESVTSANYMLSTCVVDNATWRIKNTLYLYGSSSGQPTFIVRNGGVLHPDNESVSDMCHDVRMWAAAEFILDGEGSSISRSESEQLRLTSFYGSYGDFRFGGGSSLYAFRFHLRDNPGSDKMNIAFDGVTWYTLPSYWQPLRFRYATNVEIKTLCEDGLTLPVASRNTLYVGRAIGGDGGLVKTGDGTLRFETQGTWTGSAANAAYTSATKDYSANQSDWTETKLEDPVTLAFEGTLDVQEGTVEVEATACREGGAYNVEDGARIDFGGNELGEGVTFSGTGTVKSFSATNPTIAGSATGCAGVLPADGTLFGPVFSGATLTGTATVDFGLPDDYEERAAARRVTVARFADGVPADLAWRAKGLGKSRTVFFSTEGSAVVATIRSSGFRIIVR